MSDGVEHLDAVMDLLPGVRLSIIDGGDVSYAYWSGGDKFDVRRTAGSEHDLRFCLSTDAKDLYVFSVSTAHWPPGPVSGDTITINDDMAKVIAEHVHHMIESGALLELGR